MERDLFYGGGGIGPNLIYGPWKDMFFLQNGPIYTG